MCQWPQYRGKKGDSLFSECSEGWREVQDEKGSKDTRPDANLQVSLRL